MGSELVVNTAVKQKKKVIRKNRRSEKTKLRDTKGTIFKINFKIKYSILYHHFI